MLPSVASVASPPLPPETAEAAAGPAPISPDLRDQLREVIGAARDQVFPSLVSIQVVTVQYHSGKELKGSAVGSGTIISDAGHVLTNYHVTRNGKRFLCILSDRQEVAATLVGEDPLTDLAVLQLDAEALAGDPLPVAAFGDSATLEVGDYVMAMGSPFGLSRSVSLGIVANTERVFAGGFGRDDVEEMELEQGQRTGLFTRWIQHDSLINPGNSGGPLVNLRGEVVGVNEIGGNAMGFAIPSNLAAKVAAALTAHGDVPRSWVGASLKPIRRTGLEEGVLIDSVAVDGPAAQAGLEAGDVLLSLDDTPLTVRFVEEVPLLLDRIASLPIGSSFEVRYRRGEALHTTRVTTERLEKDIGEQAALPAWGMTVQAITPKMARDWRLDDTHGVLVTSVRRGGPAQVTEPPLARGDVIRALEGEPVEDLPGLIARYEALTGAAAAAEGEAPPLLVELNRRGKNQLTLLEPRQRDDDLPPRELPKAWIGVATQPLLPHLATQLGLAGVRGFRVTRVYPGSEAAQGGLQVGDIIVALNGIPLEPEGMENAGALIRRVQSLDIDTIASLSVLRDGHALELPLVLERSRITPEEARRYRDTDFELAVRELTFFDRDENRWSADVDGVLVEQVDSVGWAGQGGIRPFDLVLRINDQAIRGLKSFRNTLRDLKRSQPERVVVVVLRGGRTYFQYLEPEWSPVDDEPAE